MLIILNQKRRKKMVEGYCVVCKDSGGTKKRKLKDPVISKTSRGGFIAKGKCSNCNKTTVCRIMSKDNAEKAIKSGEAKKGY
tara:strand:- start:1403 stop:1648 length:246 start_codon:yes stop_codon:yes gene_type:complete